MLQEKQIRVVVVDDHEIVRNGLSIFIRTCSDFELAGEAKNGEEAVKLCKEIQPDVVLMDLFMPGKDGVEATRAIMREHPEIKVIALTSFDNEESVNEALEAGAISFLLKNVVIDELAAAIRKAYSGKSTLSPEATQALIRKVNMPDPPGHDLTEREREVLTLLVKGMNNPEIAHQLHVSRSTVKNHVSSILNKLDAVSRSEAAGLAVKYNLIDM